jgi:hypothetical protein
MKIYEVYDKEIKEFNPLSKRSRELRRYQKAGKKDLQATAQNLENEYASYLGMQDVKPRNAGYNELTAFLKKKGISANIDTSVPYNQKRINQIFTKLSKDAIAGASSNADQPKSAPSAKKPTTKASPKTSSDTKPAAKPTSNYSKLKTSAMQMSAKEKRRLIQALQKDIDSRSRSAGSSATAPDNKFKTQRNKGEFKTQRDQGEFRSTRGQK